MTIENPLFDDVFPIENETLKIPHTGFCVSGSACGTSWKKIVNCSVPLKLAGVVFFEVQLHALRSESD